jgi:type III pantothenate kinase
MNLVLDFGNTRIKAGLFDKNQLLKKKIFENPDNLLSGLDHFKNVKKCLVASVTDANQAVLPNLSSRFETFIFTGQSDTPLKNLYKSANTLGSDRLAAAVGAHTFYPDRNVLTIDVGTCIKYNFVNEQNEYLGGAISPGIKMRLKAMHDYTHALPDLFFDENYNKLLGENTNESLLSGAQLGAAAEVDDIITRYRLIYPNLQTVLTGGDSGYLCKQLKNRFFANQNILLYGLNAILNLTFEK